jgi:hypothetical protein
MENMSAAGNLSHVFSIFEGFHTNDTVREIKLVHNCIILLELFHSDEAFVTFYKRLMIFNRISLAYLSCSRSASWVQKVTEAKSWWLWGLSRILPILLC